jgi:excisionase family DNA binding protein
MPIIKEEGRAMGDGTELLNVRETAEMLRMKESTIRSWILKRRIPFVRMGRRVFVRRSDAEQLIIDNIVRPRGEASDASSGGGKSRPQVM